MTATRSHRSKASRSPMSDVERLDAAWKHLRARQAALRDLEADICAAWAKWAAGLPGGSARDTSEAR